MADEASLLRAVAANHRAWFRRTALAAGGTVERLGRGLELATSGASGTIGFPPPGARAALTARVDAVLTRADALGLRMLGCMALHEDRTLGTLLVARGFEWGWAPHWMALDLAPAPGGPTAAHTAVSAPDALPRDLPYAVGRRPAPARHLAVLEGDRPVGHVVVHPWRGVAGIYDMGVAPDRRRRGVGRALTLAAARVARSLGCRHAVITATGEGEPLYRAAGVVSLGHGRTWWRHPGPRPTARQTALVEAIGFGDLATLESLDLSAGELGAEIPGGGPPLAVAVVTGRPEIADWILARSPGLVSAPVEPRGGTLLHVAVEWDDEALVRVALAHGADPKARDRGWLGTPVDWADAMGRPVLAALLRGA